MTSSIPNKPQAPQGQGPLNFHASSMKDPKARLFRFLKSSSETDYHIQKAARVSDVKKLNKVSSKISSYFTEMARKNTVE